MSYPTYRLSHHFSLTTFKTIQLNWLMLLAISLIVGSSNPTTLWAQSDIAHDTQQQIANLPLLPSASPHDWLVEPTARTSGLYRTQQPDQIVLDNGLLRRSFLVSPNLACVGLRQLSSDQALLRSIRPECQITLGQQTFNVGGLLGQPVDNFLRSDVFEQLKNDPAAFQFTGFSTRPIQARFPWKRRPSWISTPADWPPKGIEVQFAFSPPQSLEVTPSYSTRWEDTFEALDRHWTISESPRHERTSFQNEGKVGEIFALENTFAFAQRDWLEGATGVELELDPGTDQSASWGPGLTLVGSQGVVRLNLRPGKNEFGILAEGREQTIAGLTPKTSVRLRMALSDDKSKLLLSAKTKQAPWQAIGETSVPGNLQSVRIGKMSRSADATDFSDQPTEPQRCRLTHFRFLGPAEETATSPKQSPLAGVKVVVHYEMYDGIPLMAKWFTLENRSGETVHVSKFTSEILACVEASSQVEDVAAPLFPNLHVETDYTTCAMHGASAQVDSVHWETDPTYKTQVNYRLQSRCLLQCRPSRGPDVDVVDGETFESFRTWILAFEDRDETRQMLAITQMYRTIAPWVLENPMIHHVRSAHPDAVRKAIDEAAEVGFEMVIMTFGSGFNIENDSPEYLDQIRQLTDYAHQKQVALGGYSLLASRSVSPADDVINPQTGKPGGFARFGNSPCLESTWGQNYFQKLYAFYRTTGSDILEHDGSYPGDCCASQEHPGHRGYDDSRWRQWRKITEFYKWCRSEGIYLNVPDWYFLNGSNKTGMGYRETNWSLPREFQEIIERQNIHDGTRYKLPTMGWMFVPLTEYHGGGPAATIEPLNEHLDHYRQRLQNLFGAGVQACFRGPRLFDSSETKAVVQKWVNFYKQHRAILDSSLISLRRADGQDWDGWLHVNPTLNTPALALIYNPLSQPITRQIAIPLYYSGLSGKATYRIDSGPPLAVHLNRKEQATIEVTVPAKNAVSIEFQSNVKPIVGG